MNKLYVNILKVPAATEDMQDFFFLKWQWQIKQAEKQRKCSNKQKLHSRTDSVSDCKYNIVFFSLICFVSCYCNKMTLHYCLNSDYSSFPESCKQVLLSVFLKHVCVASKSRKIKTIKFIHVRSKCARFNYGHCSKHIFILEEEDTLFCL